MRKHGGTPSQRDKHVTQAAISPSGVARAPFCGGQQSVLAGWKPPPLFTRGVSSCSSQGRRQGEPWGTSPRPRAPTYLPTSGPITTILSHPVSPSMEHLIGVKKGSLYGIIEPGAITAIVWYSLTSGR